MIRVTVVIQPINKLAYLYVLYTTYTALLGRSQLSDCEIAR